MAFAPQRLTRPVAADQRLPAPAGLAFADIPGRILGLLLDIGVLGVIGLVLARLLGGLASAPGALDASGGQLDPLRTFLAIVLATGISAGYFVYLWSSLRVSAGMRLLGISVGRETDGGPISPSRALRRWLWLGPASVLASTAVYVPWPLGVLLPMVGAAWLGGLLVSVARSRTQQGRHDRSARSIVVRSRRRAS